MSVSSTANTAYLDRTTGWADSDPVTIAVWFRLNNVTGSKTIWDHGSGAAFSPQLWASGNQLTMTSKSGVNDAIHSVSANTWYFCACVFNGTSSVITMYFGNNGGALITDTSSVNFGGFTGTVLTLYNELNHDQTLTGRLTNCKIWKGTNGALSADEILNEYLKFQPSKTDSLYAVLPLLNATNPQIDMSGNGNDFTAHGAPATQREMPPIPWLGEP